MAAPSATPISLNLPSKYNDRGQKAPSGAASAPSVGWLTGTWCVTHSTLAMWRSARNVRISYKPLPSSEGSAARIDDLVEYEPSGSTGKLKSVEGVDTMSAPGDPSAWDWRGKGWLFFVHSHWEVLGWGEVPVTNRDTGEPDGVERWAVTWFAPTLFTKEGLDVYCDRKEGLSEATYGQVREALGKLGASELVAMVERDMLPVEIKLPWTEKS